MNAREVIDACIDAVAETSYAASDEQKPIVLAVIRALAEAGPTDEMREAWEEADSPSPDVDLRAMLTALADAAERGEQA